MARTPGSGFVTEAMLEEALEGFTPGGGGGGARLVSGTVALTTQDRSLPPFVVATTTGATVEGVALAAGQMAAFWYLSGEWHVMVHGQDSAWRSTAVPDTRIQVTPTGPTWNDQESGGTWTTPAQTGITYNPASGTATAGQSVTVTATISDPVMYRFAPAATTTWTHTFPDPTQPITESFDGPADAPLGGTNTDTGGKVWSGTGWKFTGDGAVTPVDATGDYNNTLSTTSNIYDVSVDFTHRAGRFGIGFGDQGRIQYHIAANGELLVHVNNQSRMSTQVWKTAETGTLRFRYDGSTATFWYNSEQVASVTGVTITPQPFRIASQSSSTRLTNLTITPI